MSAEATVLLWLFACTSLVEVQNEWRSHLYDLPGCEVDADCAIIEPGCPLGCYESVPVGFEAEAEALADELADRYRRGGWRPCRYECEAPPTPRCVARICELTTMP